MWQKDTEVVQRTTKVIAKLVPVPSRVLSNCKMLFMMLAIVEGSRELGHEVCSTALSNGPFRRALNSHLQAFEIREGGYRRKDNKLSGMYFSWTATRTKDGEKRTMPSKRKFSMDMGNATYCKTMTLVSLSRMILR